MAPGWTGGRGEGRGLGERAAAGVGRQRGRDNCASCHGEQGRGDGPAAAWLKPGPSNLAQHEYSLARVGDALWNGVAGTSMPAWRDQAPGNLAALAAVTRGFFMATATTEPSSEVLALGEQVYVANCAQCHGDAGAGDGLGGSELTVASPDFRSQRPSIGESLRILTNGVEGTSMAPWTDRLDEEQLLAVVHYLRRFFDADGTVVGGIQ